MFVTFLYIIYAVSGGSVAETSLSVTDDDDDENDDDDDDDEDYDS